MPSIFERVLADTEHLFAHRGYDDPSNPADPAPTEAHGMDLATFEQDVRTRVEEITAKGREVLDDVLPRVAKAAADLQADPLVQAIEGIADPEARTLLTSLANKLASITSDVEAVRAAAPAAPEQPVPADMAMGQAVPQMAGPVVAGQA